MATSKADRMKENAMKQVDAHNADGGLFAGMEPIQEPAKKRGRPKKKPEATNTKKSAYELSKEEGHTQKIKVEYKVHHEPDRKYKLELREEEPATVKPQKKSDRKAAFSVWLDQATAADVKRYSAISGKKLTDVVAEALTEYMQAHPLTQQQKDDYKQRILQNINDI